MAQTLRSSSSQDSAYHNMSKSPKSLKKGTIKGRIVGVAKGDTRGLDPKP